jgi:hypothetical protein
MSLHSLCRDKFLTPQKQALNKWSNFAQKKAKRKKETEEGTAERALRRNATKKLAVLSNAGRVQDHHDLERVRRNSLVIASAREKMKAWECKKMAIKHDVDILRFQDETAARRRKVSNVGHLDLESLKSDSKLYADKVDNMKGLILAIKHQTRENERDGRQMGGKRRRQRQWLTYLQFNQISECMGSKLVRLGLMSVIIIRAKKRAIAAKFCREFLRAAFPINNFGGMIRNTFRLSCLKLNSAVRVIQRAARGFKEYRRTQYVMMRLMIIVYEGPDSPLNRIRKKSKTAKDFMSKHDAFDDKEHGLTHAQVSVSKGILGSLAKVDTMNRRTQRLLKLTDLGLTERQKEEQELASIGGKRQDSERESGFVMQMQKDVGKKDSLLFTRIADYVRKEHQRHVRKHIEPWRIAMKLWEQG